MVLLGFDLAVQGSGKAGTNPEQLFAIGYAACFDNALILTARRLKKAVTGSRTSVELYVELSGLPEPAAMELVEATHHVCPYSNAVRGNVEVRLHVFVK